MSYCKDSFDAIGIRIQGENMHLNFVCIYRRPGRENKKNGWKEIFRNINVGKGIIITGDFNAHNELWNCDIKDRVGENLLEKFEERDMFIVNLDTKSQVGERDIGQRDSNLFFRLKLILPNF